MREVAERLETRPTPETLADAALANLLLRRPAAAISQLERAVELAPGDASLRSDLSAAHLTFADAADQPYHIVLALAHADQALEIAPQYPEALFNRALALQRLPIVPEARTAWARVRESAVSVATDREISEYLSVLSRPGERTLWRFARPQLLAAIERGDAPTVRRLTSRFPQFTRFLAEEELLAQWGEAYRKGPRSEAGRKLSGARWIGEELARNNSDYLLRDVIATIESSDPDRLNRLAQGHELYGQALALYAAGRSEEALDRFTVSAVLLRETGSPFLYWAEVYRAICLYYAENRSSSLTVLARIRAAASDRPYPSLAARVAWMTGLNFVETGRAEAALAEYAKAVAIFRRCRELENVLALETMIAVVYDYLGERQEAWRHWAAALKLQSHARSPRRLHSLFDTTAYSVGSRLPKTALYFQNEVLRIARVENPLEETVALWRRALLLAKVGRLATARADLAAARRVAAAVRGKLRSVVDADIAMAEGYVEFPHRPHLAHDRLTRALQLYLQEGYRQELTHLHGLRARVRLALDRPLEAERDFAAAIAEYERQRSITTDPGLQISYFDQGVDLYGELAVLQASRPGGAEAAFQTLERRKSRQLLDLASAAAPAATRDVAARAAPTSLSSIRREIPRGTALVSYSFVGEELFVFVLRPEIADLRLYRAPARGLTEEVNRAVRLLARGASVALVHERLAKLHDRLIRPIEDQLSGADTLAFIPDGALQTLPWASLYDRRTAQHLVRRSATTIVPSASLYALCSRRSREASRRPMTRVSFLADPTFDRTTWSTLRRLPGARAEATAAARLYQAQRIRTELLLDGQATAVALQRSFAESDAVFIGAHATTNTGRPEMPVLLLAGKGGALNPSDLQHIAASRTRLVLLALCGSAAGPQSASEGTLSLARALLAGGVLTVVATPWPIDDKRSRQIVSRIHRELAAGRSPAEAVRRAQLAAVAAGARSPGDWAAFQIIGAG